MSANPARIVVGVNIISSIKNSIVRKTVNIDSDQWVYNTAGHGEKLILLHGFGASKESWNDILPFLAENYSIVAVDIPGHGEISKNINSNYSIDTQLLRLNDFIKRLGLASFHIAGNSMGGAIAGAYSARYPSKVKSLWLIDPAGVKSSKKSDFEKLYEKTGKNVMVAGTVEEFDRQMTWFYHNPPDISDYMKRGIVDLIGSDATFANKLYTDLLLNWVPLEEVLTGFEAPVLITWGESDRLTEVSGAAILHNVNTIISIMLCLSAMQFV